MGEAIYLQEKYKYLGWHAKKYANKVGMMHESKGHALAKPHPYIFFTLQLVDESYLVAV